MYCDGRVITDSVIGATYDRDVRRFVKLHFNLRYEGLLDVLYKKLFIDPKLCKLSILRRFLDPTTKKYGVAPIFDDDDIEYVFESLDDSESKVRVELYIDKIPIDLCNNTNDMIQCSKVGESSENTSASYSSKSVQWGRNVSSDSSSMSLFMPRTDSEGNSRGSSDFKDDDIAYYRSFDGSSMVVSYQKSVLQKGGDVYNPAELTKGMVFETKEELLEVVKRVHISNHQEIKVVRSNTLSWDVDCKLKATGCPWKLRARKKKMHGFFEIMETKGPHTCLSQSISQDHCNLNSSNMARVITSLIAADPSVSHKVLLATIIQEFKYTPSMKKVRDARKIVSKIVYGSWE